MKRILLVLAVALVMTAMVVASGALAFADQPNNGGHHSPPHGSGGNQGSNNGQTGCQGPC